MSLYLITDLLRLIKNSLPIQQAIYTPTTTKNGVCIKPEATLASGKYSIVAKAIFFYIFDQSFIDQNILISFWYQFSQLSMTTREVTYKWVILGILAYVNQVSYFVQSHFFLYHVIHITMIYIWKWGMICNNSTFPSISLSNLCERHGSACYSCHREDALNEVGLFINIASVTLYQLLMCFHKSGM